MRVQGLGIFFRVCLAFQGLGMQGVRIQDLGFSFSQGFTA